MKEFYKFIASRDIREHLTKINYQMNTAECAFVVYESWLPLKDKHEAYRNIIDTMEDVKLPDGGGSLHQVLKTRMELENILVDVFEQQDKAVYMYSYIDREESREVYADWRRCLEEAFEWREDEEFVRIEKKWIAIGDERQKCVSVLFNADRDVINVSPWGMLNDDLSDKFWQIAAAGADAHIPIPFKRGDILHNATDGVFVYESDWNRSDMGGYMADELWGVGLYSVGRALDAEYYVGTMERKDRILKDISLYLKGKIDLARFIERCKG